MLLKIKERLNLGEYETEMLRQFDEYVLLEAMKIFEAKSNVTNPFKFVVGCCVKIQERTKTKPQQQRQTESKPQPRDADLGIVPSTDLTFDENISLWISYEEKATQDWAEQSDFHKRLLANRKVAFMRELERHTPENLERWRNKAKEIRETFVFEKDGVAKFVESLEIEQKRPIFNDNTTQQPKTQVIEKDSTMTNVVRSFDDVKKNAVTYEDYLERYANDPTSLMEIEKLKEHLPRRKIEEPKIREIIKRDYGLCLVLEDGKFKTVRKDEKDYEAYAAMYNTQQQNIEDEEQPHYNPFDELELLDSPLLL